MVLPIPHFFVNKQPNLYLRIFRAKINIAVLHGDLADLSTRTLYARCRACCEGYRRIAYVYRIVDSLEYNGVRYRTVSGWKHSSTKVSLAGVIILRSRFYKQNHSGCSSIGSGTVFIRYYKAF